MSDGEEALAELEARDYDVVISDVRMPQVDGLTAAAAGAGPSAGPHLRGDERLRVSRTRRWRRWRRAPTTTSRSPSSPRRSCSSCSKAEERRRLVTREPAAAPPGADRGPAGPHRRASSEAVKQLHKQIRKLAPVSTTVLITGESGTGKELVARALHELSPARGHALRPGELRRHPAGADRVRALRPRPGRLHRRPHRQARPLRRGRRRHALPRRGGRAARRRRR